MRRWTQQGLGSIALSSRLRHQHRPSSRVSFRAFLFGRLLGCAGAGLLQVRACALIPCGDGLAAAFRIPDAGGCAAFQDFVLNFPWSDLQNGKPLCR
jgi:hypothetical protein